MTDLATLLRFSAVGLITAAFYFGLLALVVELELASPVLASVLCYIGAVLLNYQLHYSWTFAPGEGAQGAPHGKAFTRYLLMVSCGLVLNAALMYLMVHGFSWHYLLAQFAALVAVVTWNFVVSHLWVFRA